MQAQNLPFPENIDRSDEALPNGKIRRGSLTVNIVRILECPQFDVQLSGGRAQQILYAVRRRELECLDAFFMRQFNLRVQHVRLLLHIELPELQPRLQRVFVVVQKLGGRKPVHVERRVRNVGVVQNFILLDVQSILDRCVQLEKRAFVISEQKRIELTNA